MNLSKLCFLLLAICFIAACKKETGSFKTAKGYEYIVNKKGSGDAAKIGDFIFYTIVTTTDNGKELQSMLDPDQNQPIKVVDPKSEEGKQNMWIDVFAAAKVGDSLTLVMPVDSMPMPDPSLGDAKKVLFNIAIKKIMTEAEFNKLNEEKEKEAMAKAEAGKLVAEKVATEIKATIASVKSGKSATTELTDGVKIYYNAKGTGAQGANGKNATVNYYGVLENGTMFDNSFERGQEFTFPIGQSQVIKGWDVALANMKVGDKATVFIPSTAAYGDKDMGTIPANSPLVFYIEVVDIK